MSAPFRWVLIAMGSRASCWALALLVAAVWPLGRALAPFQITTEAAPGRGALEVAFVAALIGAGLALDVLAGHDELYRPCSAARRLAFEGAGVLCGAAAFAAPTLVVPPWMGDRALASAAAVVGLLLALAHLAGVGLVLLRTRASGAVRWGMLLSFAWVLPILSVTDKGEPGPFTTLLGASLHVSPGGGPAALPGIATVAPITALWLAAGLLGSPRTVKR